MVGDGRVIDAAAIDAVIFDLDGVITRTADVHRASWEGMFNEYLRDRASRTGESHRPFQDSDYLEYIDGKPRYDGVQSFLASRNVDLPWGSPEDPPEAETICGLGNRKNGYFLAHLATNGVEPYESSVRLVRRLQREGIGTALISSSRNVTEVLAAAGLSDLFGVIIDGVVAAERQIPGKPDPAVFLAAADRLGAAPERAVVVEDALSGVEAGARGGFAMVIGVDRAGQAAQLAEHGATVTVSDLAEVEVVPLAPVERHRLPSATAEFGQLAGSLAGDDLAVFLDYDGTLTPIVAHPDLAVLAPETREVITELASVVTVAVLSGRDVTDVRDKMRVRGIYYAGSHGFDIVGPDGQPVVDERLGAFTRYLAPLDEATAMLEGRLGTVEGSQVERKRYAIAVHYRRVAEADYPLVERAVREVAPHVPDLRVTTGKMIFEFRPDFDWDKGQALEWLLRELELDRAEVTPVYIGDDTTDEDAFRAIHRRGIGIVVGRAGEPTLATWVLEDTDAVHAFLSALLDRAGSP